MKKKLNLNKMDKITPEDLKIAFEKAKKGITEEINNEFKIGTAHHLDEYGKQCLDGESRVVANKIFQMDISGDKKELDSFFSLLKEELPKLSIDELRKRLKEKDIDGMAKLLNEEHKDPNSAREKAKEILKKTDEEFAKTLSQLSKKCPNLNLQDLTEAFTKKDGGKIANLFVEGWVKDKKESLKEECLSEVSKEIKQFFLDPSKARLISPEEREKSSCSKYPAANKYFEEFLTRLNLFIDQEEEKEQKNKNKKKFNLNFDFSKFNLNSDFSKFDLNSEKIETEQEKKRKREQEKKKIEDVKKRNIEKTKEKMEEEEETIKFK